MEHHLQSQLVDAQYETTEVLQKTYGALAKHQRQTMEHHLQSQLVDAQYETTEVLQKTYGAPRMIDVLNFYSCGYIMRW